MKPEKIITPNMSLTESFNASANITALVFDLDNTLTDISSLYQQMEDIYAVYLSKRLNMPLVDAYREVQDMLAQGYYIQDEAFKRHGIAVARTLQETYDPKQLDFSQISVDPQLRPILNAVQCPKYILTNAPSFYAEALLDHLNLKDCFDDIAGTDSFGYVRKPQAASFDASEQRFNLAGKNVHFFEDTTDNLDAAYYFKGWIGHLVEEYRNTPAYPFGTKRPHYVRSRLNSVCDIAKP